MTLLSTCISTTSPSINSVSSLILTPIALRKACVKDSVFDICKLQIPGQSLTEKLTSREKTSDAVSMTKGTSLPSV